MDENRKKLAERLYAGVVYDRWPLISKQRNRFC